MVDDGLGAVVEEFLSVAKAPRHAESEHSCGSAGLHIHGCVADVGGLVRCVA